VWGIFSGVLPVGVPMLVKLPGAIRAVELMPFAGAETECNKGGK